MRGWRFWEHQSPPEAKEREEPSPGRRFGLSPRSDVLGTLDPSDPERSANSPGSGNDGKTWCSMRTRGGGDPAGKSWRDRVRVIDEAIASISAEVVASESERGVPGRLLSPSPVTGITAESDPTGRVAFDIGDQHFEFVEPLDWAERGTQLAIPELEPTAGDVAALLPPDWPLAEWRAALELLERSLFVFATDVLNRTRDGRALPDAATLAGLARPDETYGGWADWLGHSPMQERHLARRRELENEVRRLESERDRELAEEAKWADRLPIARRRLAEVDAEIAAIEVT